ncbi:RNA polymerase sigma factor [Deinococcus arenicola]|uniref:Sigma-70 family RNA polymerase sigma factor n=1 Tax=Deinococcus arenicola TaxID=2994950 RepID=A0ABU4DN19_9DEIO|nr:sigma-70 family RNA polymerase sigma factor [Deinococcus sp. ZS9-10]MDV6373084.1 sigma-70 family RNA polymerase sigma factor [Deinococcus sp. ZS9-10]
MPDSRFSPRPRPTAAAAREGQRVRADSQAAQQTQTDAVPDTELDAHLALRLCHRDELALAEVYDLHSGAVFGVLHRLLGDAAAQEVLQDVFLRLWERPENYDPERAGLKTFLLVMARSRALDRLRATKATLPLFTEEGAELPLPDTGSGPVARSEDAQRRDQIRDALVQLSPAHRETVERAYLVGESREEISSAMNVPVGTVKSRLSYALKHLKKALGKEVETWLE